MKKILICLPVIVNVTVLDECLQQILYKRNLHILIIDNNAEELVKERLEFYKQYPQVTVWSEPENIYVTAAWNEFLKYFIDHDDKYDKLIIMNSDLTLQSQWHDVLTDLWENDPDLIVVPTMSDDKRKMWERMNIDINKVTHIHHQGIAGIFITLTKKQAQTVYPIPHEIKVWFNDSWIYTILGELGEKIVKVDSFIGFHHVSTTINGVDGIREVIEDDKIAWRDIVYPLMQEKIKHLKG